MTVLVFGATMLFASLIVGVGIASIFTDDTVYRSVGHGRALLGGLLCCAASAYALFAVMNPDPLPWPEPLVPYLKRTVGIAALSAFVWLPIYLAIFSALARRHRIDL